MSTNPLSPAEARVVDPVLSNVARGYKNAEHVWMYLFPIVQVMQRAGIIIQFSAEDFAKYATSLRRAPGGEAVEIEVGYAGEKYSCENRSADGKVPREIQQEAAAVPGIDLLSRTVQQVMNIISLAIEIEAAELATNSANYTAAHVSTLAGANQWDHADATPAQYIEGRKELIAEATGMEPNVLTVGIEVHRKLKNNPDVIDRIKHTQGLTGNAAPLVNASTLAQYFDIGNYVVGRARTGEPGNFEPVWGRNAVLAYSDVTPLASQGSPSFGYTYRLSGYPMFEESWFNKKNRSWMVPGETEDTPVIAGKDAGVLLQNVVA